MILFFTGTGNSRYAAEKIAAVLGEQAVDLFERIRAQDHSPVPCDERLVIVTPTYAWRIPHPAEAWLRETSFPGAKDVWFVMTCGGDIGRAEKYNRALAASMGLLYRGTAPLVMPENYIAMFDTPDAAEIDRILTAAEVPLKALAERIKANVDFPEPKRSLIGALESGIVNRTFYPLFVRADAFRATDRCLSCGRCEELCPLGNITMQNGRPVWGKSCTHCMACICRCPAEAVEYGKSSIGKPRYVCPGTK